MAQIVRMKNDILDHIEFVASINSMEDDEKYGINKICYCRESEHWLFCVKAYNFEHLAKIKEVAIEIVALWNLTKINLF